MIKTPKKMKRDAIEKIILLEAMIRYYKEQIDGGFERRKKDIKKKMDKLQEESRILESEEKCAVSKIERDEKKIDSLKKEIKITEVAPLINRTKKIAAQLSELKTQVKELNLSKEDLEILKRLIDSKEENDI